VRVDQGGAATRFRSQVPLGEGERRVSARDPPLFAINRQRVVTLLRAELARYMTCNAARHEE